jgi:oligopeptide transport system ATP-binding protein
MSAEGALLEVSGLKVYFPVEKGIIVRKRVGWVRAVDGVDFQVSRGESLGLVGESGCGKSTTAMAVARLEALTAGKVLFEGRDLAALNPTELRRARKDFQLVFQDPWSSLDPRMRVRDIIAEPMQIFARRGELDLDGAAIEARVASLMESCGLSKSFAERYPHEFSGGQRQRVGIARALALGPKLIIADEPVSALDVSIQSQILNLLKDLQRQFNLTFLFIAHDLAVVEYFCDRIAVMYLGRIVEIASSSQLNHMPLHPYTRALLSAVPLPDPAKERSRKRLILKGDVPSPSIERAGCPFRERCSEAMERCAHEAPRLSPPAPGGSGPAGPGHEVSCFLYQGN